MIIRNHSIAAKTAFLLRCLFFGAQILLAIATILVICASPCGAANVHKYKVKSVCCKTGVRTLKCRCGKTKRVRGKKGHKYSNTKDGIFIVTKCTNCGKVCKKFLSEDIPSHWDSRINKALKTAKKRGDLPGFVYLTDPHWTKNAKNSPAIVSFVTKQMGYSYAVCGGDVVTGCHDNKQNAVAEIEEFYSCFQVPVLSIEGNHDSNCNGNHNPDTYLSKGDINRLIYAHNPAGTHTSNGGDFAYIDDSRHRVRYITFYYAETAPVADKVISSIDEAVSTLNADWSVVLFSHAYWHYAHSGDEPYAKPEAMHLATKLLDIQAHSDATIVLWHVGHIHSDRHEVLSDSNGNQLLVVSSNCDAYQRSSCWGGLSMTKGTATEQVIEIVQIDKNRGKIYMTRIGAGRSRSFHIPSKIS